MLFSDPFAGFLDCTVKKGVGKKFEEYEKTLTDIANKSRRFGYIFKAEAKLCSVLSVKYELGVKTREAYKAHDTEALRSLLNDYSEAIKRTKEFYKAFSYMWHKDFKPHGFAVQDMRIGGLIQRLEGCKKRLSDYIDGRLSKIDELEEVILPFKSEGEPIYFNNALNSASVNVN